MVVFKPSSLFMVVKHKICVTFWFIIFLFNKRKAATVSQNNKKVQLFYVLPRQMLQTQCNQTFVSITWEEKENCGRVSTGWFYTESVMGWWCGRLRVLYHDFFIAYLLKGVTDKCLCTVHTTKLQMQSLELLLEWLWAIDKNHKRITTNIQNVY